MKAAINMIGLALVGITLAGVIILINGVPQIYEGVRISSEATALLNVNDETSKLVAVLGSGTDDAVTNDVISCVIDDVQCGYDDEYINSIFERMDAGMALYSGSSVKKTYGSKNESEKLFADVPLPGGRSTTVALITDIKYAIRVDGFTPGWRWPLDVGNGLTVSHCYGEERIKKGSGDPYTHSGVDLEGNKDDPVYAVSDGDVLYICDSDDMELTLQEIESGMRGNCHGYGNNIVIKHGNVYYARYSHLESVAQGVTEGGSVNKGDVIGYVGSTGYSFGDHLDFKVYTFDPGRWGYNANIDPLCMYSSDYLDNVVKLRYAPGDTDCQESRLCIKYMPSVYTELVEEG